MKQLLLGSVSVIGLVLATWVSQSAPPPAVTERVPHHAGAIQPRLSEDGEQVAVSYQGAIWRMPRSGGSMTRLTSGTGFDIEPAWSPDGKLIAYVNALRMGDGPLQIIEAETGLAVPLPAAVQVVDIVAYAKLQFHPDGRILGNFRIDGQDLGLALLDPKTGKASSIVKPSRQTRFALSKDGQWLVHTASMDVDGQQWGNDGPQADVFRTPTAGGETVKLTRFRSKVHDVCFSADGSALYLVSELGGAHYDLWRVPLDDPERGARRITSGQADEDRPSVSRDGRWLAFTDNREGCTALTVRDLSTGIDTTVPIAALEFGKPLGRLLLTARDAGKPTVARVSIQQVDGKFYAPPGALHRVLDDYGHFYCGNAAFSIPAGEYRLRAWHGPEFKVAQLKFTVEPGKILALGILLERWTDPATKGWYSGENHIHANYGYGQWYCTPQTMLEQCAGENLRVCNFMVANSDTDGVFDREFFRGQADPVSTPETVLAWNQEFRSTIWGHMTLVNLDHLVEPIFTGFQETTNPWDVPTNSDIADRTHLQNSAARGRGLVNYTHSAQNPADPYLGAYTAKGIPVDVALGKIDTLDLNASYAGTIPLWYRLLNCGFRLPPSAGTDVFLNRIRSRLPGGDRAYVKIDGEFSYKAWIDGLRAGRTFVTNGPMLELRVEDQEPGGTVRLAAPREVKVTARATSQLPLTKVELVRNGQVVATLPLSEDGLSATLDGPVSIPASSWLSLRASGKPHPDHTGGALEAHASPVTVLIADKPMTSKEDATYFLAWIDRLSLAVRSRERIPPELRQHVESQLESARAVYSRQVEK